MTFKPIIISFVSISERISQMNVENLNFQQAPASQVDLRLGSTWLGAGVDISLDNLGGKQQKAAALTIKQLQQQQNKGADKML